MSQVGPPPKKADAEEPLGGTMTAANAKKLREKFAPELIGKLPKPTKADNPKGKCAECGGFHGLPAVHLDFVGHAATTDRLLSVDPNWTWEPMGYTPEGIPALDRAGNLWIKLTICGVTRPGVGDGKNAKECVSDAIRNAAMRFGVALDLWSKQDLDAHEGTSESPPPEKSAFVAPAPKRPTVQALEAFAAKAAEYKKAAPDFDVDGALQSCEGKDAGWLRRATERLEQNIEDAKVAA